ncbi:MAG: hypothetical protein M3406_09065, partial [Chloroflexota bacterium]|nr:hypothetical protein [Chloroflexota bacterium]
MLERGTSVMRSNVSRTSSHTLGGTPSSHTTGIGPNCGKADQALSAPIAKAAHTRRTRSLTLEVYGAVIGGLIGTRPGLGTVTAVKTPRLGFNRWRLRCPAIGSDSVISLLGHGSSRTVTTRLPSIMSRTSGQTSVRLEGTKSLTKLVTKQLRFTDELNRPEFDGGSTSWRKMESCQTTRVEVRSNAAS